MTLFRGAAWILKSQKCMPDIRLAETHSVLIMLRLILCADNVEIISTSCARNVGIDICAHKDEIDIEDGRFSLLQCVAVCNRV